MSRLPLHILSGALLLALFAVPAAATESARSSPPAAEGTIATAAAETGDPPIHRTTASTITGHVESFEYIPFLSGRRCWVYLPPRYDESTRSYPVLYMHDGQALFDAATSPSGAEWKVDETCEDLISSFAIEPIIVVGIESGSYRCIEYTPWYDVDTTIYCWNGGAGDWYLQDIRDVLIPEVNRRYRTKTGPENTYMAGSSLGGLISMYAGYEYDDTFGRVAALSTYFPWADEEMLSFAAGRPKPALTRFYQDMGTFEFDVPDADSNGVNDFVDDLRAMRTVALSQGFVEGEDFVSYEAPWDAHYETFWAERFPDVLRFLIDPAPPSTTGLPGPDPGVPTGIRSVSPNPFRASSRIELSLASPGHVRADIYDVRGRLVRRLVDERLPAGTRTVVWDGRDDGGRRAAPGVYWLAFRSGTETLGSTRLVRLP